MVWFSRVAARMPRMIGTGRLKVAASTMARSWVLSPISPTATTAVEVNRGSRVKDRSGQTRDFAGSHSPRRSAARYRPAGPRAIRSRPPRVARRGRLPMNRFWTLSDKPVGAWPQADTFELREGPMPKPGPGQALTRTIYVSLDPYQWGYKRRGSDAPGAPCHARTVSQVVESRMDGFAPSDLVFNTNGWAEYGLM